MLLEAEAAREEQCNGDGERRQTWYGFHGLQIMELLFMMMQIII
jgi:hypothetical protein